MNSKVGFSCASVKIGTAKDQPVRDVNCGPGDLSCGPQGPCPRGPYKMGDFYVR